MREIILPANGWTPRPYQKNLWSYLEAGGKRAVAMWHRRAGKDEAALHWSAAAAHERVGNYWHMLPEAAQARKAIWAAVNPHTGRKRIDEAFPLALRAATRNNEMSIEFTNGSTWQVVGSDNYNSLVGAAPIGIVFSEWALADPMSWSYLRPILAENGGWAMFIFTPRGRNHGSTFYNAALGDPTWYAEMLRATETSVFTTEQLAQEEAEYVREFGEDDGRARFRQEYLCDVNAAVVGAYYGRAMTEADDGGRIKEFSHDARLPVHTAWDLGIGDSTAIWMFQIVGSEIRCVDYLRNSGVEIGWYVNHLRALPYTWGTDLLPHDAEPPRFETGKSIAMMLRDLGRPFNKIVPRTQSLISAINETRMMISRVWFERTRCAHGIESLREYRREWDEKRKIFHDRPLHDWASDGADAFRCLAQGLSLIEVDAGWGKPLKYPAGGIV